VAEKNRTKAVARLRFFVARAAEGGEAYTVLLCAVCVFTIQSFLNIIVSNIADVQLSVCNERSISISGTNGGGTKVIHAK
jgi:hypothetical protein